MHFYQHHIGDYNRDTSALSVTEHGAYRLLMDEYYVSERPLPNDLLTLCRICRAMSKGEKLAVDRVAKLFFEAWPDGLRHKRIEAEIAAYQQQAETSRQNGKRGGRPRKPPTHDEPEENPAGFSQETQREPETNLKRTLTKNQELGRESTAQAHKAELIVASYPRRDSPAECFQAVLTALDTGTPADDISLAVRACADHIAAAPGGSGNRYVPSAKAFFGQQQWRSPEAFAARWTAPESQRNKPLRHDDPPEDPTTGFFKHAGQP